MVTLPPNRNEQWTSARLSLLRFPNRGCVPLRNAVSSHEIDNDNYLHRWSVGRSSVNNSSWVEIQRLSKSGITTGDTGLSHSTCQIVFNRQRMFGGEKLVEDLNFAFCKRDVKVGISKDSRMHGRESSEFERSTASAEDKFCFTLLPCAGGMCVRAHVYT